jgi:hypothetical protein
VLNVVGLAEFFPTPLKAAQNGLYLSFQAVF